MTRHLLICGAGNPEGVRLAIRVNERSHRWDEITLLDDDPARLGEYQMGIRVAGPFSLLASANPIEAEVVNLVARTTRGRRAARARIAAYGIPWAPLISRDVDLLGADIGSDLIAYQHATLGPEARLGEGVVVFMSATVGHECRVGDHCVIAANAVLNARVRLGTGVYVGSNAVILPEIEIGDNATIGAGAIVFDHVPAGATVVAGLGEIVSSTSTTAAGAPADGDLGTALQKLWSEILGVDHVPGSRNFFDLGGNSLMALRLAQRIETATGVRVCAVDLFHYPTLDTLRDHLTADPAARNAGADAAQRRAELRRGLMRRDTGRVAPTRP
jgi:sugar O-acyltransferase (sialic acid O-acetyltransferase NeuD family)